MCMRILRRRPRGRDGSESHMLPMADNRHRGGHHHQGHHWHAVRHVINVATMFSPTLGGMHKPHANTDCSDHLRAEHPHNVMLGQETREHLRELYLDMCGGRIALWLKRERLVKFLTETQGEDLEARPLPLKPDRYTFEQFIEVWSHYYSWDAAARRPLKVEPAAHEMSPTSPSDKEVKVDPAAAGAGMGDIDLTRPIANYFISSSHNTYLMGNQLSSAASAEAYKKVLLQGCRCVEIDVWNHPPTSRSRTPNRSKSPHPEHKRHLSQHSVTSSVHDGIEVVTKAIAGIGMSQNHSRGPSASQLSVTPSHNRSRSNSQNAFASRNPGCDSNASLDPLAVPERQGRPLSRHRSRSSSGSTTVGGTAQEPVVMHAHKMGEDDWTLGRPVGFREVCKAIAESAFVNNPLPVIVSLEVHVEGEQQEAMVAIMKEEWGTLLLDKPLEHVNPRLRLPTLGELQNKILVKVKKGNMGGTTASIGTSLARYEPRSPVSITTAEAHKKVKIGTTLASLAVYTQAEPFNNSFETAKNPAHVFSLDEDNLAKHYEKMHEEVFKHNRTYFMRVYPDAAKHVLSSNPDPARCWRKGVQMVALNWQTLDEAMMLNHAMFAGQGGWVPKPKGYRSSDVENCVTLAAASLRRTLDLTITVLAGQYLPHPQHVLKKGPTSRGAVSGRHYTGFRPRVKVDLHVETHEHEPCPDFIGPARVDKAQLRQKTEVGKSDNPNWSLKGETIKFKAIPHVVEELSFVRFRLEDENIKLHQDLSRQFGNLAGWACIRLDRLQQGHRFLSLFDATGHPTEGKLLVRIEKRLM